MSVVGVEGLIDERKLVRSQLLLTVDQLGKLGKIGFSDKACVTSVMLHRESKIAEATLAAQCTHHSVYTRLCLLLHMHKKVLTAHGLSQRL